MCLQDGEGAVQDAETTPDMNGHSTSVTPDVDGFAACNGVHPEQVSQGIEIPTRAPEVSPEIHKVDLSCKQVHAWAIFVPLGMAEMCMIAGTDAGHARPRVR